MATDNRTLEPAMERFYAFRCILPTGEHCVLQCAGTKTMRDIKLLVWKKKAHTNTQRQLGRLQDNYVRLATCRHLHLADDVPLSRVIELFPMLRESNDSQQMPQFLIIRVEDIADAVKRLSSHVSKGESILAQGFLSKQKNANKFKKFYCVFQSSTLFLFSSHSSFQKNRKADAVVHLGSCKVNYFPDTEYCFQVGLGETIILKAADRDSFEMWKRSLDSANYQYAKSVIVPLVEHLEESSLNSEGLFRLAGTRSKVDGLKREFECGRTPSLDLYRDEHVLADVLKITIRELNEPLLTPSSAFETAVKNSKNSIESLKGVVANLPAHKHGLAWYLMRFLRKVSKYSEKNMMTPANLGIVFGPNLLRANTSLSQQMFKSNSFQDSATLLIEYFDDVFPEPMPSYLRYSDKLRNRVSASVDGNSQNKPNCNLSNAEPDASESIDPRQTDDPVDSDSSRSVSFCSTARECSMSPDMRKDSLQSIQPSERPTALSSSTTDEPDFDTPPTLKEMVKELIMAWRHWNEESPALRADIAETVAILEDAMDSRDLDDEERLELQKCLEEEHKWRAAALASQKQLLQTLTKFSDHHI